MTDNFFFPVKRKKLLKAINELGFSIKQEHGSKHDLVKCIHNGKKTTLPRHGNEVSANIVKSICDFFFEKEVEKKILLELIK